MVRVGWIVAMMLVVASSAMAQVADFKKWSEGMLSWDDFRGAKVEEKASSSHLAAALTTVSKEEVKNGNVLHYRITAEASMSRSESYADSDVRSERKLRYYQLMFDQLEIYRRRLQNELNTGITGLEADRRLAHYRSQYKDQVRTIERETAHGSNDKKLQEWEYFTRKDLEEMGLPDVPEFVPGDWSYGLYLGLGGSFATKYINNYFGNCVTFTAGITVSYKRVALKADVAYGQPSFKNRNVFGAKVTTADGVVRDAQGPMNNCATLLSVGAAVGFTVVDSDRIAITPYAGVYWSGYSWNMANLDWVYNDEKREYVSKVKNTVSAQINNVGWQAGVDFDIKLHRYVSSTPLLFSGQREQYTSSLRITPFVMYSDYKKIATKGYHLGVAVTYSGIARALKME